MRPHYHYAAAANWLSDPNGLVFAHGEWHLFYQYNPQGEEWGHMSWGHAVSRDLALWQELPVAIPETADHAIFSGAAVIDAKGAAGFGRGALIALYTAASNHSPAHQSQALAWSSDKGRTWQQYAQNPVLDRGLADFRDPNVFWHEPSRRWIMVVVLSAENRALIYGSVDLKHWDELSVIEGTGAPGRIWECPLLIELPVEGSAETRWLFKVDVLHDGPGSGAIYQTGRFDGVRFVPDEPTWHVADHGRDFYAAVAWHEPRDAAGRPVWIGWMGNHAYQGKLPTQGWRGAMSLPRRLSLVRAGTGYALCQQPEPAAVAAVPVATLDGATIEQAVRLELPGAIGFRLVIGDPAGHQLVLERRGNRLVAARRDPVSPILDAECLVDGDGSAAFDLWLDGGSLELLSQDGRTALTLQHRLQGETLTVQFEQSAEAPLE
ncbi:glycoside hydrolase family 32 protein [Novosphingobium aquiterrae]|uniref:Glycoside hydrolase family 32 protein n=1 Tax=Novosphingobium aquiterrae TaxID=624388 RepID=A0ABV6PG36_9SPHN